MTTRRHLSAALVLAPLLAAVPAPVAVRPGHRLIVSLHAVGVQVYRAVTGKAGRPE